MKEFSDFEKYSSDRSLELVADIISHLDFSQLPEENGHLSQEEYQFITTIAVRASMTLIQQYHEWLSEHPDESHQ